MIVVHIDLGRDGVYDAPPTDASWRITAHVGQDSIDLTLPAGTTTRVDLGGW